MAEAKLTADVMISLDAAPGRGHATEPVVAMGTSTGGTQALEAVLTRLPAQRASEIAELPPHRWRPV